MRHRSNGEMVKGVRVIRWRKQAFVRAMTRKMHVLISCWIVSTFALAWWACREAGRRGEMQSAVVLLLKETKERAVSACKNNDARGFMVCMDTLRQWAKAHPGEPAGPEFDVVFATLLKDEAHAPERAADKPDAD